MFQKILIANRGEIACRIARTARNMGVQTVAIYSDADRDALHVKACDEAVYVGQSEPQHSYLDADKVLEIARQTQAEAIHPGYGFLSENAGFAEQCAKQGITFIGPTLEAIRAMGSKSAARHLMQGASVPVVPGYDGPEQSDATLIDHANKIGFPVLIKAVAGGGGKGLRVVETEREFVSALEAVKRESMGAFGDDAVILEKYLPDTRHIEVQVFADSFGAVVHLYERDCSLQRRHQKVFEEAPAPGLSDKLREQMTGDAINCSKAINYLGAGTVEFLLAPDDTFYFMEMNTRLQVEHPVTEMITGQDLVAWQLQVAAGQPLPLKQSQIAMQGHAIEVRVYAENPQQNFLPSIGQLAYLNAPKTNKGVRVDTGVAQGDFISPYYDPMIAKLICQGDDRVQALARLEIALGEYQLLGTKHNLNFLATLCAHTAVQQGGANTRFIDSHLDTLIQTTTSLNEGALVSAAVYFVQKQAQDMQAAQSLSADPWSPWADSMGWRVGSDAAQSILLQHLERQIAIKIWPSPSRWRIETPDRAFEVKLLADAAPELRLELDGAIYDVVTVGADDCVDILFDKQSYHFERVNLGQPADALAGQMNNYASPMPGKVIACHVKVGDAVNEGDQLIAIEAMKMEHAIVAAADGEIATLNFKVGDQVNEGDILLTFAQ